MAADFCHLHNHSEYSLLDGANRIPNMVEKAVEMGMDSLALSDHGVMFGVMEFYMAAKKAGVKPIIGVEAYVAPRGILTRGARADKENYHLLLLAKNEVGYRNLCKLSTTAALEGYYYKPRVDHDILRKYSEGVIATSACLGSEICGALMNDDYASALKTAEMYAEIFGQDNFFIELQDHGLPEQEKIKKPLLQIAKDLRLKVIATNDAHYLCREDSKPHDVLLCIQTGAMVADERRMRFETEEFYLKSQEEMKELFRDVPEAIENTIGIAESIDLDLEGRRPPMPQPDVPSGLSSRQYLRQLAEAGLQDRAKEPEAALERLNYELGVIEKTGFDDYFLLVREFAKATRDRGIFFGVRGSAAGSLVSYCIGITDVDPVEHDLTFERFLNPERISMPDIDMDFEDARRGEIIDYVSERFGTDHVAQIITFGTLGAKAALRDCARVMGMQPAEVDALCKLIPTLPGWSIDRAMKELPEFRQKVTSDPKLAELTKTAKSVEGIARHSGVHAAGVVITKDPLVDYVPLYRDAEGKPVTAFEMGILEKLNLLKMDFLGLSNLTVLSRAISNIKMTRGIDLDIRSIPQDDEAAYQMLGRGETAGVFQLEGNGMTAYIRELKPANITELSAMIALYRPGPMEHIGRFIDVKYGRQKATYLDERMRPTLESTFGVIVYQDQVLKLVQSLAGFTLGKADVLRRAMGKKDRKTLDSMQAEFEKGALERGLSADVISQVWELLIPFAGYAFNKAHAVCYGILAYQTAYLKANYPIEYLAALLSVYRDKEDRVISFIEECSRQKIKVLPPDVNLSQMDFSIEGQKAIRFGLAAIKGVGVGIAEGIIAERLENGPYTHLFEFAARTKEFSLSKTSLEPLIKAGALDGIDPNRNRLLAAMEGALLYAADEARNKLVGQDSLFEGGGEELKTELPPITFDVPEPTKGERLAMEKEVLGLYVSDHPLRGLERTMSLAAKNRCSEIAEMDDGVTVTLAGLISGLREVRTKEGRKMATIVLEDLTGQASAVVFPTAYETMKPLLEKGRAVTMKAAVSLRERNGEQLTELRVLDLRELDLGDSINDTSRPFVSADGVLVIEVAKSTESQLREIKAVIDANPGTFGVELHLGPAGEFPPIGLEKGVAAEASLARLRKLRGVKATIE